MTIKQIKEKLIHWTDFYGQDLLNTDDIEKCKTKKDCYTILSSHRKFLELQSIDARTHLESFMEEIGL